MNEKGRETMCIVSFSYKTHTQYPLIIAANRDEFYIRPTEQAHIWENAPHILAGKDAQKGGTWLGVSNKGRMVAITNFRDPKLAESGTFSRGKIATDFLQTEVMAAFFARDLQENRDLYGPFNVLLYDGDKLIHYNNITDEIMEVPPGIHCISNATINTPWPKAESLKAALQKVVEQEEFSDDDLFRILLDQTRAADDLLPSTGVPLELEQKLSSTFIHFEGYGTRSSTVIRLNGESWDFAERTFENGQQVAQKEFHFAIEKKLPR